MGKDKNFNNNNTKVLIVGGTWNIIKDPQTNLYGKASGLVTKVVNVLLTLDTCKNFTFNVYNGGNYNNLSSILEMTPNYDIIFWWANVDNSLPKIRNVKELAPFSMLVNSKRDDSDKYSFQELLQRSLAAKANLTFKFKKVTKTLEKVEKKMNNVSTLNINNKDDTTNKIFNITIFDPLGSVWYDGTDLNIAVETCMHRLLFLKKMTRQQSVKSDTSKGLVMSWYFDQFKQPEYKSDKKFKIPDEQDFVNVVHKYAMQFQKFMSVDCKTERFVGNASLRPIMPPQVGRCGKGMPSFRHNNVIFVSKRNIDKQFITLDNFVPVYMNDGKLMYCGDDKPSVDTPVQIRLYNTCPQINYMLHSHCYIKNAPFTKKAIPCGAIEEFYEIIDQLCHEQTSEEPPQYPQCFAINLLGHGSIVMWSDMSYFHEHIEPNLQYYKRSLPEIMY